MRRGEKLFLLIRAVCATVCWVLLVPELPVNYLAISGADGVLLASPLSDGAPFVTTYVHSVQLTPVIDEYRITGGNIWTWEERVQSHNAGLPFSAPPHGKFILDSPWMIVQGGRRAEDRIVYRVGTSEIGKNTWSLSPFDEVIAHEKYTSLRVFIDASVRKFKDAPLIGWQPAEQRRQR